MLWKKRRRGSAGWIALAFGDEGVHGVSVRFPGTEGGRPRVEKCLFSPSLQLSAETLNVLAATFAAPDFEWTLLCRREDYRITVLPRPAVEEAELLDSLRWALGSVLDYPVEEAIIDRLSIPALDATPGQPSELYVVAAPAPTMRAIGACFEEARLRLGAIDIYETAQRNYANFTERAGEGLGIVAPGTQGVQITFSRDGELFLDRFIAGTLISPDGDNPAAGTDRGFERVAVELQRSIFRGNEALPLMQPGRILVAPGHARLLAYLQTEIPLPVEPLGLAEVFDLSAVPELAIERSQAAYFFVLGAALRNLERRP